MSRMTASRRFALTVASSLLSILAVFSIGEIAIRLLVARTVEGQALGGLALAPKDWVGLRSHMSEIWKKGSGDLAYLVYDSQLGWKIGPNRRSANGLYMSGPEGIRATRIGESFANLPPKRLVAVLGDSYAFGEEVENHNTFPSRLEEILGPEYRVLNFGVPGYGVDQIYLRYVHDVLSWNPDIVLFSFVSHDLLRTMSVYTFLAFPQWEMPFSKPRFLITPQGLRPMNVPTASPDQMLAKAQVFDLPFIEHDIGYKQIYWRREFQYFPYLFRYFVPRVDRWLAPSPNEREESILAVNKAILSAFLKRANEARSLPVVVYLPTRDDFAKDLTRGRKFIQQAGVDYLDPLACLSSVDASERFTSKNPHYTPQANAAVATCVGQTIRTLSEQRFSNIGRSGP